MNTPGTGATVLQIGTEGRLLAKAGQETSVAFNPLLTLQNSLVVAPVERPDILIDFSAYLGKSIAVMMRPLVVGRRLSPRAS